MHLALGRCARRWPPTTSGRRCAGESACRGTPRPWAGPISLMSSSSVRARRRPLLMWKLSSRSGSLIGPFPPHRGAGLLEVAAHDDDEVVAEARGEGRQPSGVLEGGGACRGWSRVQTTTTRRESRPASTSAMRLAGAGGDVRRPLGDGKLLEQDGGRDQRSDLCDAEVVGASEHVAEQTTAGAGLALQQNARPDPARVVPGRAKCCNARHDPFVSPCPPPRARARLEGARAARGRAPAPPQRGRRLDRTLPAGHRHHPCLRRDRRQGQRTAGLAHLGGGHPNRGGARAPRARRGQARRPAGRAGLHRVHPGGRVYHSALGDYLAAVTNKSRGSSSPAPGRCGWRTC